MKENKMNVKDIPIQIKKKFLKFWRSEDTKVSLIRDVFVAFIIVFIILMALWSYTGQWFGTPMVAIESGSMTHDNEPFGKIGFIDAGDMVLLVKIDGKSDIETHFNRDESNFHYNDYGDVIIYRPYGDESRDQIIHRAICWIQYNGNKYTVEEYDIYNASSVNIPELSIKNYRPPHSGFITKGDNNDYVDQLFPSLCDEPIRPEWISGKARGEITWVGTLNLIFNDIFHGKNTVKNIPGDSLICLVVLIGALISIPLSFDIYDHLKSKKETEEKKK